MTTKKERRDFYYVTIFLEGIPLKSGRLNTREIADDVYDDIKQKLTGYSSIFLWSNKLQAVVKEEKLITHTTF